MLKTKIFYIAETEDNSILYQFFQNEKIRKEKETLWNPNSHA